MPSPPSLKTVPQALLNNFLGAAPSWYKKTIIICLIANPLLLYSLGEFITGWLLLAEFMFTLAMALRCYPLQPGGLLALEAIVLGLASPDALLKEVTNNFEVILLLIFMVAGIYFMRELLLFVFTKLLLKIKSKILLSLLFSAVAAFLSAFLDALTVTAVLISVAAGFYQVYHQAKSKFPTANAYDHFDDNYFPEELKSDLEEFRAFLRNLVMHGAVGTALGGVCTLVGEPQNLLIADKMGWEFAEFFFKMAPVTIPVLIMGLISCFFLEKFRLFGYGHQIPESVIKLLRNHQEQREQDQGTKEKVALVMQALIVVTLIVSLSLHLASVGIIGLMVIILLTSFNGVIEEHKLGQAFEEALPFTALLVVFFAIVAVIHEQHLFSPVSSWVFQQPLDNQPTLFFMANALLSIISDNVFVATIYIDEVTSAYADKLISKEHSDVLAIAINTGTNIPSIATPNGQAAFLFLLTSSLAPLIHLSYLRMVLLALPYTITLFTTALIAIIYFF